MGGGAPACSAAGIKSRGWFSLSAAGLARRFLEAQAAQPLTTAPKNLHVVQSAQTRTRPLAIDMHVGGRANTRSRDPGRTKLYCQSTRL